MSIQVVCPNGHSLRVDEAYAGRTGVCPHCKARVAIPRPVDGDFSEDAILGLLGGDAPPRRPEARAADSAIQTAEKATPKKPCSKCNQEISIGMHICPHCHTYIAGLRDF